MTNLQLLAHLSRWLARQDLAPGELTLPEVERFLAGVGLAGRQRERIHPHF